MTQRRLRSAVSFLVLALALSTSALAQDKDKDKPKAKKKDNADIENIGNRNINKGFNPFDGSVEQEIAIGRQVSREIEAGVRLVNDPVITEYINRVGQNIVRNSDAKVPFTIKVIDDEEINAVSLPGGFFYVNTGLIMAAEDEAELAGVMAHEIAHIAARHAMEQQGKGTLLNILAMPVSIFTGGIGGMVVQQGLNFGALTLFSKFSRGAEEEADWLGLQYLYKSGYDPNASVSFFEKLQARESARRKVASLWASHPATEDRVSETKENIEIFLPERDQHIVTTSEFQKVKARLTMLQNTQPEADRDRGPSLRQPNRRRPSDEADQDAGRGREPEAESSTSAPDSRDDDDDGPPVLRRPQEREQQ
jgi:predicted Zn-dependent protease